jgi:hypothetical protein
MWKRSDSKWLVLLVTGPIGGLMYFFAGGEKSFAQKVKTGLLNIHCPLCVSYIVLN